jgi:hypothetical protein
MTRHDTLHVRGRSVDPGLFEHLGKQAAHLADTAGISLTDAVVQTVGHEKLNSEQVRRVVEFANIEAFQRKYASTSGHLRHVHIDGGPADPVEVLQALHKEARPREVTIDALEYSMPPDFSKSSAASFTESERTRAGVLGDVMSLRSKLAAGHDELVQSSEAAKERMSMAVEKLAEAVVSATSQGTSPSELLEAWSLVDAESAKVAFRRFSPFMKASNQKVASRIINPAAPVVSAFAELVKEAKTYQAHQLALRDLEKNLADVTAWLEEER